MFVDGHVKTVLRVKIGGLDNYWDSRINLQINVNDSLNSVNFITLANRRTAQKGPLDEVCRRPCRVEVEKAWSVMQCQCELAKSCFCRPSHATTGQLLHSWLHGHVTRWVSCWRRGVLGRFDRFRFGSGSRVSVRFPVRKPILILKIDTYIWVLICD